MSKLSTRALLLNGGQSRDTNSFEAVLSAALMTEAFYRLCLHMLFEYHQLEFDLRLYLILLDDGDDIYGG